MPHAQTVSKRLSALSEMHIIRLLRNALPISLLILLLYWEVWSLQFIDLRKLQIKLNQLN